MGDGKAGRHRFHQTGGRPVGRPVPRLLRRIGTGLGVVAGALTALAIAASPAGAFHLGLMVRGTSSWQAGENGVAVDNRGDMFVNSFMNLPDAGIGATGATKVIELAPTGHRVRTILTHVPVGSDTYVDGQVAVTRNGRVMLFAGGDSSNGHDYPPFLGEWSTATGRFIKGTNFDLRHGHYAGAVAVDATGTRVYVGDWAKHSSNRIYEFSVPGLHEIRSFAVHGASASPKLEVGALAAGGPDDDLYVSFFAAAGNPKTFIQVYGPDGTFIRQVGTGNDRGVAVNPLGMFVSGGPHGLTVWQPNGRKRRTGVPVPGGATAEAFDAGDELFATGFKKHRTTLLKFAPRELGTVIGGDPGKVSTNPTVAFGIGSNDPRATFQCRLDRAGFDRVPFAPCRPLLNYLNVPNGLYTFEARGVSYDGWIDRSPATYSFRQAVPYAHARITAHPATLIGQTSATFAFTSNVGDATFQCQIVPFGQPQGAFKPCTSPVTFSGLAHGLYNFEVEAITADGYAEPLAAEYQFAVDPSPPAVTAPVASIAAGQQLGLTGTTSIALSWSASDANTPDAQLVDTLQVRFGPSAAALDAYATVPGLGGTGQPRATVTLTPGSTRYQFRAQAQNNLGVVGTSADGDLLRLRLVDNGDPAVTYSEGWNAPVSDASAIGGTVEPSTATGATASLAFTGSSVGVVGALGPSNGSLKVCIDPATPTSGCKTVSESSSTTTERALIFTRNGLTDAQHTIQITANSGTPILLDGFVALR